jgi:hypothetical protein
MTTTTAGPRLCACGCGQEVIGSRQPPGQPAWKRGHKLKGPRGKLTPLPGPEDDLDGEDDLDAGEAWPDGAAGEPEIGDDLPDWLTSGRDAPPAPPEPEITADRPPGRLGEARGGKSGKSKTRVTAGIRKDVEAKIRFVLLPAGQFWQIRDQLCGGTFVQQEPEISGALAEIVCDSPDLLAWFTGPAGGFMKYFRLLMAVQPVAVMVWMHHMAHATIVQGDAQQPPQQQAYAA